MSDKVKFKKIGANYREDDAKVIEQRAREFGNVSQYIKTLIENDLKGLKEDLEPKSTHEDFISFIKGLSIVELLGVKYFNL